MPMRSQGYCGDGSGLSGLHWVCFNGRVPHLGLRQEPQVSSPFLTQIEACLQSWDWTSKATLWVKAQHEGALPTPCIVRKDPRVPHTARRGA